MEDLRSAAVPGIREDDHVRGEGRLVVFYADLTCPHCAVAHEHLQGRRRAGRLPPPGVEEPPPARARARARRGGGRRARAPSGRSPTPPTPTRVASRTRTCGTAPGSSGSTSSASTPTAAARRSPPACSATSRTRCAPGQPAHRRSSISRFRCVRRGVLGLLAAGAVLVPATANAAGRCGDHPWCDTALSADARAGLLLEAADARREDRPARRRRRHRRLACYAGSHTGTENGVPRLDVPRSCSATGPSGPRQGQTTAMPIPMALAATFDRRLAVAHGAVDRRRGAPQGQRRRLRADGQHHANAAGRAHLRGLRRGPVPRLARWPSAGSAGCRRRA